MVANTAPALPDDSVPAVSVLCGCSHQRCGLKQTDDMAVTNVISSCALAIGWAAEPVSTYCQRCCLY